MARVHVCPELGCPELEPCPTHSRPKNGWGGPDNRDLAAHMRWARAVKRRDRHACVWCGSTEDVQAHHLRPGWELEAGITLCATHHRSVDAHAR